VVLLSGMLFLIVARISVETGLFFIQPTWHAVGIISGMFGVATLGPNILIILALISTVMTIDPRVAIMPIAANALRFSENAGVKPQRMGRWMMLAAVLALGVGAAGTLYFQYCQGGGKYTWATDEMPKYPFEMLRNALPKMDNPDPSKFSPLNLGKFSPDPSFLEWAGVGFALMIACSVLRLRYNWWPIHPVLFLTWGTYAGCRMAPSFLLGWFIKTVITKFGGGVSYRNNKPIFMGMLAGEFVAGIFWMVVGVVFYLIFGSTVQVAKPFTVHP
jgi:hypothetical protein